MSRPTRATIDLAALRANLQHAKACAPKSKTLAVIKANGYGHGILNAANGLKQADGFGVACLEEASQLRKAGYQQTILLLEGVFQQQELAAAHKLSLDIVVHSIQQLVWLEASTLNSFRVWLKVDTGMHRLGIQEQQFEEIYLRLKACVSVNQSIVLMTHLANADDRRETYSANQLAQFEKICKGCNSPLSIANSAALMSLDASHTDWVRPGIMLYGANPFGSSSVDDTLIPAMTLRSQIIAIERYQKGDKIGYGGVFICPEDMNIAVVAIGYGDGYPRHATDKTPVLVNGIKTNLVGLVSMDMITIDLRPLPAAAVGDEVILWGQGLAVEDVAESAGTISYELLCHVTQRVHVDVINSKD